MKDSPIIIILGTLLTATVALFIAATIILLNAVAVYYLWPAVIPHVFPGLVASGAVAGKIGLLDSLLLYCMVSLLFKAKFYSQKKG